jgi:preprotein translocase subunit SecG
VIFDTLNIFFFLNSILIIILILNQNESTKEAITSATETSNPLQNVTWFCIIVEFILFLAKSKINNF